MVTRFIKGKSPWRIFIAVWLVVPMLWMTAAPAGAAALQAESQMDIGVTDAAAAGQLLQFASGGHVLGFDRHGTYIVSPNHMLKTSFVGAHPVDPQADSAGAADNTGAAAPMGKVTYTNLWDGVNLVYEAKEGIVVESTYFIDGNKTEESLKSIRLSYNRPVTLDDHGNLMIAFETGNLVEKAPVAWQDVEGAKRPVVAAYKLESSTEIGFTLGNFIPGIPVVIDPDTTWNTFFGGTEDDYGLSIAVDSSGNVYVTGNSYATWGSPVRAYSGGYSDAFIVKLDSSGVLQWNTFLGGTGFDEGRGIAVESSGNVYVTGWSDTTWGSPVRTITINGITSDAFAAKLNSSGVLQWNTFLGGTGEDAGVGIAVDSSGNICLTGVSFSTWGTPLRAYSSEYDAFAAKLSSSGALIWNTFLGGTGGDSGNGTAVDSSGNVYVTGESNTTWGSPERVYTSDWDTFVAKLNSSGVLQWNTFLGGTGIDVGMGIIVDYSGNAFITGYSGDWGSPVRAFGGGEYDAFVAKLDSSGVLQWNTSLGGTDYDFGWDIAVDSSDNVHVTGSSSVAWGNPVRAYSSYNDAFTAMLTSNGELQWNTFLGGTSSYYDSGIAVDSNGNVYVAGNSNATWGNPVRAYSGNTDAFAVKLDSSGRLGYPTVASILPSSGQLAGGTAVTIIGTNFVSSATVTIGGGSCTGVIVDNSTQIIATTPSGTAGAQDVVVTNPDNQTGTLTEGFTYIATPTVTLVNPNAGSINGGGPPVNITGTNFLGATSVTFGGTAGTSLTVVSSTSITVVAPAYAAGKVVVAVITPGGTGSKADAYEFKAPPPPPIITAVTPGSGSMAGGTIVTISGGGLGGPVGTVTFNGVAATAISNGGAPAVYTCTTPASLTSGLATIVLTNSAGTATNSTLFTYYPPVPTISSISPNAGAPDGGTLVTITGTYFTGATALTFGGIAAASYTVDSATSITATTPAYAAEAVDVTVTNSYGTGTLTNGFIYLPTYTVTYDGNGSTSGTAPIDGNSPYYSGATVIVMRNAGGLVRTGYSFNNWNTLADGSGTVYTSAATFSITANTTLYAQWTANTYTVTYDNNTGSGNMIATTGNTDTSVTLRTNTFTKAGYTFNSWNTAANGSGTTYTNGQSITMSAGGLTLYVKWTAASQTITYDNNTGSGSMSATTGNTDASVTLRTNTFTKVGYTFSGWNLATGGTGTAYSDTATITMPVGGLALYAQWIVNQYIIAFDSNGGSVVASITQDYGTSVTAPADPTKAGYNFDGWSPAVPFTMPAENTTCVAQWTALVPTVISILPTSGPLAGGTVVTITGNNFTGATAVSFGDTAAFFSVNADDNISAISPAGSAGTVDVTVTTAGGTSATSSADQFTYMAIPTITGISPSSGPLVGGTIVTIIGTNFVNGNTAVTVGGVAGTNVAVTDNTTLTVTTPVGTIGNQIVVVTTPGGSATLVSGSRICTVPIIIPSGLDCQAYVCLSSDSTGINIVATGTTISFTSTGTSQNIVLPITIPDEGGPYYVWIVVYLNSVRHNLSPNNMFTSGGFTYVAAPTVASISPSAGPPGGGTTVTIIGTNFVSGNTTVIIGETAATNVAVTDNTTLTATSPSGTAGAKDVVVITPGGTATVSLGFTFIAPPTVVVISPTFGPTTGGISVTISGMGFYGGGSSSAVSVVNFGSIPASGFTVDSDTKITATSPAENAGTVDVTVTTVSGISANSANCQFTYIPVPTVANISPTSGQTAGGTTVTITGTNFVIDNTTVYIGGTAASNVTVTDNSTLTLKTPTGTAGAKDVVVTTPGGSATITGGFTYIGIPDTTWNTFLGGTSTDLGYGIAVDSSGNVYVTGECYTTWGSPVRAYSGNGEAFAAKLNSSGMLLWNTFLGGTGEDAGVGIAVDSSGNVYVTGFSVSTWGNPLRAYSGADDGFVAKLDSNGLLQWNTFLGGSMMDQGWGIALDSIGNVYVTGFSNGAWGNPVRAYSGNYDAFAVKLNSSGVLLWNTFLGGTSTDIGYGIAVDSSGNVYVTGESYTTWGSPVKAYTTGPRDAFATQLNNSGVLLWNTFMGGTSTDIGYGIAVGSSGNVYVTGVSGASWGSPIKAISGTYNTFAAKLDSNGILQWNTFMGGTVEDYGRGIKVDSSGNVYVTGYSYTTWGKPVRAYTEHTDAFAVKLDSGGALQWNTFLGGTGDDIGQGIAVDSNGNVYVTGQSNATWGNPVRAYSSGEDAFDAFTTKLDSSGNMVSAPTVFSISPSSGPTTGGTSITVTGTAFTGAKVVSFGSSAASSYTVNSDTQITATAPAGTGTVDVNVTTTGGTSAISSIDQFTYIVPTATVNISVTLQGGSRPDAGWVVPLTVKFFTPGTITPALYTFDLTTAKSGNTAIATATGILPGTYDIRVVTPHCLTNIKKGVVIAAPSSEVDLGTLLEGNANDNNIVNIADFGILASAYGKNAGEDGYDAQADFDRNGIVNIADFGLLAANYGKNAPVEVP